MYKVLISDPLAKEGLEILDKAKKIEVVNKPKLPIDELKKVIKDCDALIVRSGTKVTKEIIDAAKKLKVIGRAGVGIDNVDVEAASRRGIIVMNSPGGNTISTAEQTMSLILALSRNIPQANASLKDKKWDRKKFKGVELFGKTLGVIGLGRIGAAVAKRAASFGMKIVAADAYLTQDRAKALGIELLSLKKLLPVSDYITIHVPLTDETRHIISDKEFSAMKKGARIVNCARGGIIDEKALAKALKSGKVAGAALDVFEKEPPVNNELVKMDNVVSTPHLGASTQEAQIKVAVDIANQITNALLGKGLTNTINVPCVDSELCRLLDPYINLGEKIGAMQAQLADAPVEEVRIRYRGDMAEYDLQSVTIAIVKGLLTPVLGETVNHVNACVIAKERGIDVIEAKTAHIEDFANLISVTVKAGKTKCEICGSVFLKSDPRIVKIDRYYVEVVPSGHMIVISNKDVPGIVGSIGTLLGKHKVNIAGMTFGREKRGGNAITVLNVDSELPAKALKEIKKTPAIKDAKLIKL